MTVGGYILDNGIRYYPIWWISYNQWMANTNQVHTDLFNDILIARIFGLPFTFDIPISLDYIHPDNVEESSIFNVVGCGRLEDERLPTILRTASLPILSNVMCINKLSNVVGAYIYLDNKYLCTYNNPYTLLHDGDSGGPLLHNGNIVGVSIAVCPNIQNINNSDQVNIHLSFYHYYSFINSLILLA
ncbi:PREDICTED: uncharacterized protein LOC105360105 isoform X2 [Ceratosolen solmsi marchali]|nr:PREDICTED: uncharacterized protein LOC105360105 isoform X2 [Ceratosolen solmsi marchali]